MSIDMAYINIFCGDAYPSQTALLPTEQSLSSCFFLSAHLPALGILGGLVAYPIYFGEFFKVFVLTGSITKKKFPCYAWNIFNTQK